MAGIYGSGDHKEVFGGSTGKSIWFNTERMTWASQSMG